MPRPYRTETLDYIYLRHKQRMTTPLEELLDYKPKEPKYVLTAFRYADEYADGLFMRGCLYGIAIGVIITLILLAILI